jgi:ABC-type uncharacterized transport system fused permease/ATPase subunit
MDSQIINDLFSACIKASNILGIDSEFADKLIKMLDKLPKPSLIAVSHPSKIDIIKNALLKICKVQGDRKSIYLLQKMKF